MGNIVTRYTGEGRYDGADLLLRVYTNQAEGRGLPGQDDWLVLDVAIPKERTDIRRFFFGKANMMRKLFVYSNPEDIIIGVGVIVKRMHGKVSPDATVVIANDLPAEIEDRNKIGVHLCKYCAGGLNILQVPDIVSELTPKGAVCKYCFKPGLIWYRSARGWRLTEKDGGIHNCIEAAEHYATASS